MSLPDTVFIFVLALIIFGPKKLPEIGRQIGKLVGEFRRASNEFKFQIEEELRQAERTDQEKTISPPATTARLEDTSQPMQSEEYMPVDEAPTSLNEHLPIGQHPNPEAVMTVHNEMSAADREQAKTRLDAIVDSRMPVSLANITAAVGSQARTTIPYAPQGGPEGAAEAALETDAKDAAPYQPIPGQNDTPDESAMTSSHSENPSAMEAKTHHG